MRVVLYGRPYCGKGTIAKLLVNQMPQNGLGPTSIFSMSGCLRAYADMESTPGQESAYIKKTMYSGKIVEAESARRAFQTVKFSDGTNVIYDGVPRQPCQLAWFSETEEQIVVIHFELSRDTAMTRRKVRIAEAKAKGEPIRPEDRNLYKARGRQDEYDSYHSEMLRLFHELVEDGFHTVDAGLSIDFRVSSTLDFILKFSANCAKLK